MCVLSLTRLQINHHRCHRIIWTYGDLKLMKTFRLFSNGNLKMSSCHKDLNLFLWYKGFDSLWLVVVTIGLITGSSRVRHQAFNYPPDLLPIGLANRRHTIYQHVNQDTKLFSMNFLINLFYDHRLASWNKLVNFHSNMGTKYDSPTFICVEQIFHPV